MLVVRAIVLLGLDFERLKSAVVALILDWRIGYGLNNGGRSRCRRSYLYSFVIIFAAVQTVQPNHERRDGMHG